MTPNRGRRIGGAVIVGLALLALSVLLWDLPTRGAYAPPAHDPSQTADTLAPPARPPLPVLPATPAAPEPTPRTEPGPEVPIERPAVAERGAWIPAADPERAITGMVTDPTGTPVPGIEVRMRMPLNAEGGALHITARTDTDGRYTHDAGGAFGEAPIAVEVALEGPSRWSHALPPLHRVRPGAAGVDFQLVPLPAVRLRVVDATDGRPIPAAAAEGWHTERDGDALLVFLQTRHGTRVLSLGVNITAPGYLPTVAWLSAPEHGVVEVREPVRLEPGIPIAGRLRDADGQPLSGWVIAEPLDVDDSTPELLGTMTSTDGAWHLGPIRAGRYRVLVLVVGRPPARHTVQWVRDGGPTELVAPDPGVDLPAGAPRFTWAERRDLRVPCWMTTPHAAELLRWLEAMADAPVELRDDAATRLAATPAPALPAGEQFDHALRAIATAADLHADAATGVVAAAGD